MTDRTGHCCKLRIGWSEPRRIARRNPERLIQLPQQIRDSPMSFRVPVSVVFEVIVQIEVFLPCYERNAELTADALKPFVRQVGIERCGIVKIGLDLVP